VKKGWFRKSYRRNLVDMHIEEWDDSFLSKFDPETYVDMLVLARVDAAMIYANSHVGYCYWPTKVGHMHRGIKGRDILGQTVELCHEKGMSVILYYSLIYNNWAYDNHPDWRMKTATGKEARGGRYGICCPNSSYPEFAREEVQELCDNYDFEGIFFDMTFWPVVCYCEHCRNRFHEETGLEIPVVIDWHDPRWVAFQEKRTQWLAEFAASMTAIIKQKSPDITVEHQSSTAPAPWRLGYSIDLARQNDYLGGDFYGGSLQQSFICKLYDNLTINRPFEFMTSCCPNLRDHTTRKSRELLRAQTYLTLAHNGAFLFIDAIDPRGTLNKTMYEVMGDIFDETSRYEKYLGGRLCQDVGIYFSFESKINLEDNGKEVSRASSDIPHVNAALGAARTLIADHVPFGVVTRNNLDNLASYSVIILPDVPCLSELEADALRNYVAAGGSLYASRNTPVSLLGDVFGLSSESGHTEETVTYIAPCESGIHLFPEGLSSLHPLCIFDRQARVTAVDPGDVLATITLPYTDPGDSSRFASIHSNPPGVATESPAFICREFGKGKVFWSAASLESVDSDPHRQVFFRIIRELAEKPFTFSAEAPQSVEITVFEQAEQKRYLINLVNFQRDLPNIPVSGVGVNLMMGTKQVERVIVLPDEHELSFDIEGDYISFEAPELDTFLMLAVDYK